MRESSTVLQARHALLTPWRCRLAAIFFFIALIAVGSLPGKADALSSVIYDKFLHVGAYGLLAGLIYLSIESQRGIRAAYSLFATAVLATLDEFIQSLLPYRHANLADWQTDMLGACLCVGMLYCWQSFQKAPVRNALD